MVGELREVGFTALVGRHCGVLTWGRYQSS